MQWLGLAFPSGSGTSRGDLLGPRTVATVFCQKALRDGGEFEAEITAPALTLRLRARGAQDDPPQES